MATISGCRQLKVNLKAKIYIYVNSTTQRFPNKVIKIFQFESFCHLPPVSLTPVANLEMRISPRIFEKIRNSPKVIIRGLGETDSRKNQKQKISWHCPFKDSVWAAIVSLFFQPWVPSYAFIIAWRRGGGGPDTENRTETSTALKDKTRRRHCKISSS